MLAWWSWCPISGFRGRQVRLWWFWDDWRSRSWVEVTKRSNYKKDQTVSHSTTLHGFL